jgi:hypothetical protein
MRLRASTSRSTMPSAANDIGMRIRNSSSERLSRAMWRRSSMGRPPLTSQTS